MFFEISNDDEKCARECVSLTLELEEAAWYPAAKVVSERVKEALAQKDLELEIIKEDIRQVRRAWGGRTYGHLPFRESIDKFCTDILEENEILKAELLNAKKILDIYKIPAFGFDGDTRVDYPLLQRLEISAMAATDDCPGSLCTADQVVNLTTLLTAKYLECEDLLVENSKIDNLWQLAAILRATIELRKPWSQDLQEHWDASVLQRVVGET